MSKDQNQSLRDQLQASTEPNGRVNVVTAKGDIVGYPPGTVRLVADVENGVHLVGLKPGARLATAADIEKKVKDNAARDAKRDAPAATAARTA